MQERGQRPFDNHLVARPQAPRLVTADQDPAKPIIQTEKEEETPEKRVASEICTADICSS